MAIWVTLATQAHIALDNLHVHGGYSIGLKLKYGKNYKYVV